MNLSKFIELINVLGPKLKEAWPLILALIQLFGGKITSDTGTSYAAPASPSAEFIKAVDLAKANGISEEEATEVACAIQALQA